MTCQNSLELRTTVFHMRLPGKSILMVIAPQDYCERQLDARHIFEREGANVTVASVRTGRVRSLQGGLSNVTKAFKWLDARDYDALLVIGGIGAEIHLWPDRCLQTLIEGASTAKKIVGAICSAPVVLARAGVLAGRRATVGNHAEAREELRLAHAELDSTSVVRAEHVITAANEGATQAWADEVIRALTV